LHRQLSALLELLHHHTIMTILHDHRDHIQPSSSTTRRGRGGSKEHNTNRETDKGREIGNEHCDLIIVIVFMI